MLSHLAATGNSRIKRPDGVVLAPSERHITSIPSHLAVCQPASIESKDEFRLRKQAHTNFTDRRQDAAEAKKRLLEKFKSAPKADDPEMAAKRAEREAMAKAREERRAERERLKLEERERKAAEAAAEAEAAHAAANAEAIAREAEEKSRIERAVADAAAMKAKRDQRYAARKARQR